MHAAPISGSSNTRNPGSLASAGAARRFLLLAAATTARRPLPSPSPPVAVAAATMSRSSASPPSSSSSSSWHSCDSSEGSKRARARSASPTDEPPSPAALSPTCSGSDDAPSPSSSASPQRPSASPSPLPGLSPAPPPPSGSVAANTSDGLHDAYTPWLRSALRPGRPRDGTASGGQGSVGNGSQQDSRPRQRASSWLASPSSLLAPALWRLSLTPAAAAAASPAQPPSAAATTPLLPQEEDELDDDGGGTASAGSRASRLASPVAASVVSVASTEELVEVTEEEEEEEDDDEVVPTTIGRGLMRPGGGRRQVLLSDDEEDDEDDHDDGDLRVDTQPESWSSGGQEEEDEGDDETLTTSSSGTTAAESDSTFGLPSDGSDDNDSSDASTSSSSSSSSFADDELATPDGTPGAKKKNNKKNDDKKKDGAAVATPAPASGADQPGGLAFARRRERLARELYAEWNALVFDGRLPPELPIVWNPRLRCTAGQVVDDRSQDALKTHVTVASSAASQSLSPRSGGPNRASASTKPSSLSNQRIPCRLELSPRVLDRESRLRDTLAHEMAHVAAWAIDKDFERAHGPTFQRWSRLFERRVPGVTITTRHSYGPAVPQCRWVCSNAECSRVYSRSKLSIDVRRHVCGLCKGKLLYQGRFTADGSALLEAGPAAPPSSAVKAKRPLNAFGLFVKENYAATKASAPRGANKHADVMALLSARWREMKPMAAGGAGAGASRGGEEEEAEGAGAAASSAALVGAFAEMRV